ncbi:MAG: hypothetical protein IJJ33_18495, partial [Victivallales bacterium]|nr:hypothetical protein [Victivallales bacterium]
VHAPGLYLPGWPCQDVHGIYGLNPDENYALFPRELPLGQRRSEPSVSFGKVHENVILRFFYEEPGAFLYAEFGGEGQANIPFTPPAEYQVCYVNDHRVTEGGITGELPLRVLLLPSDDVSRPPKVRKVNAGSGLQLGVPESLPALRKVIGGETHFHVHGYGFKSIDTVFKVNHADEAVEFTFRNDQSKYGNGTTVTALVNGREIRSFDCCPKNTFDIKFRRWHIPVGQFQGERLLFTVRVDNKASTNADMQWVALPKLVRGKQEFIEEFPSDKSEMPTDKAIKARPSGALNQTLYPEWKSLQIKSKEPGAGVFRTTTTHFSITSTNQIPFEKGRTYYLSGEFRKPEGGNASVYLGIAQYDIKGRQILGNSINRIPGTLTTLSRPAEAGDTKLWTFDASQWVCQKLVAVGKELPAEALVGTVENIEQYGGDWGIFLDKPLKRALPAGATISLHSAMNTHFYTDSSAKVGADFQPLGGQLRQWPGAISFEFFLLSKDPIEFRNLKVESFLND